LRNRGRYGSRTEGQRETVGITTGPYRWCARRISTRLRGRPGNWPSYRDEPDRDRGIARRDDLPVASGSGQEDAGRDQSAPGQARRANVGCGRPSTRLARSAAGAGRQASDRRKEDSRPCGLQRGASRPLPRHLLFPKGALGDHPGGGTPGTGRCSSSLLGCLPATRKPSRVG